MTQTTVDSEITLVLGAGGKTGRRVAERLERAGRQVRRATRRTQPAFDWENPATWPAAVSGVSAAYVTYQPDAGFPGAADAVGAFAATAAGAGVQHLVLLTGRGEAGALRSEEALQAAGVPWTIIRSSFFAQNFSEAFLLDAVRSGVVALPAAEVPEPFADVEDIADIAAVALTQPGHQGRVYEVTGPRLVTFREAVDEIAAASGRPVSYLPITPGEFTAGMVEQGIPDDFAKLLTELFVEILDGHNASLTDGVSQALGRPARDFSDYVQRTAAAGVWS